jgi:hypothetical protein
MTMPSEYATTLWPVERVRPYENNPRKNASAVAVVARSIATFGFRQPIVVDREGVIVVGHTRWRAAQELGLSHVPVHVAAELSADAARAYRLADNRTNEEAEWDNAALGAELAALLADDYADIIATGFSEQEIEGLVGHISEQSFPALNDADKPPFQQITFTLHLTQLDTVQAALTHARDMGAFTDGVNENSNGNALARVCEMFLDAHRPDHDA